MDSSSSSPQWVYHIELWFNIKTRKLTFGLSHECVRTVLWHFIRRVFAYHNNRDTDLFHHGDHLCFVVTWTPHTSGSLPLESTTLFVISTVLFMLRTFYKWRHTACDLLRVFFCTQPNALDPTNLLYVSVVHFFLFHVTHGMGVKQFVQLPSYW